MKFHGQSVNLEWEHATDVYGEPTGFSIVKKSHSNRGRRFSKTPEELEVTGMKGLKREIIELRLYTTNAFGKETTILEKCYETYDRLRIDLYKYEVLKLTYPQFMQWINATSDKEVIREPDYVRLNYQIKESQVEKHVKKSFFVETSDDIILPRGV